MTDQSEKRELAQEFWRWLHFEKEHFNASLWELLEKLNGLWLQGKIGVTQRLYELFVELLQTQRTLNDPQVNLTYIEGVLDAHRGAFHWAARKFNEAELFFRSSAQHFADSGFGHYNASVVQMALGDMLEQRGRFNEALKAYQRGLHCSEFWSTPKCDALRQEIMKKFNRTCKKLCPDMPEGPDSSQSTWATNSLTPVKGEGHKLPTFPVVGLASAGASVLTSDKIEGYGVTETITVYGDLYNIHSLKADQDFRIRFHHDYFISPVEGNSMNLAGIQNGDYVLLERPSNDPLDPKNGDIVLAVAHDEEGDGKSEMILKRYCKEGKEFWLKPESSEEGYEARQVSPGDVRAIAIAVLKRIIDRGLP